MFARQGILTAALLAVAMRAVVPTGYMPGSIPAGEWMVLCPANSAAAYALLEAIAPAGTGGHDHHAHHGHHGHHGADSANGASAGAPESCPLGTALGQTALVDDPAAASQTLPRAAGVLPPPVAAPRAHPIDRHYPVRGPPIAG